VGHTRRRDDPGFTLIELMIAVCIIGVLASVAVPTYTRFMTQARGSEGVSDLGALYRGAVAYWERPIAGRGSNAVGGGRCIVGEPGGAGGTWVPPFPPGPEKRTADFQTEPSFAALGFTKSEPGYFSYLWDCNPDGWAGPALNQADYCAPLGAPYTGPLYVFFSAADVDGDNIYGGYHLRVYARQDQLQRAPLGSGPIATEYMPFCPMCVSDMD
jgi:prepilin-type N-terminal cleavage/methylation domain-containing protein